jgi:2'-5' RNA ligase
MPYAITLRLDGPAAEQLEQMQRAIADATGNRHIVELGYPPHVTLAVLSDDASPHAVEDAVVRAAEHWSAVPITLGGLGIFPGAITTIWAAPAVAEPLPGYHGHLIAALGADPVDPHYRVGAWVPHVTLGQADRASVTRTVDVATSLWQGPIRGRLDQVEMVRFSPVEVLCRLPLASVAGT